MSRPCWTCAWWWCALFPWRRGSKERLDDYQRYLEMASRMAVLEVRFDKQQKRVRELEEILLRHIQTPPLRPLQWDTKR